MSIGVGPVIAASAMWNPGEIEACGDRKNGAITDDMVLQQS